MFAVLRAKNPSIIVLRFNDKHAFELCNETCAGGSDWCDNIGVEALKMKQTIRKTSMFIIRPSLLNHKM